MSTVKVGRKKGELNIGDSVMWESQAGNFARNRIGHIFAKVQPGEPPELAIKNAGYDPDTILSTMVIMFDHPHWNNRKNIGYLVAVSGEEKAKGKERLYFPLEQVNIF